MIKSIYSHWFRSLPNTLPYTNTLSGASTNLTTLLQCPSWCGLILAVSGMLVLRVGSGKLQQPAMVAQLKRRISARPGALTKGLLLDHANVLIEGRALWCKPGGPQGRVGRVEVQ